MCCFGMLLCTELLSAPAAVMRGPKRIDLKKIVDKGLDLAKRSAEVSLVSKRSPDVCGAALLLAVSMQPCYDVRSLAHDRVSHLHYAFETCHRLKLGHHAAGRQQ